MARYVYQTQNTCSRQISFELEGDVVHNVSFVGGCPGNLQAIPRLVEGLTVAQVTEKCGGVFCGAKNTSCADQLARAVQMAYDRKEKEEKA